jgi:hypothetical protein
MAQMTTCRKHFPILSSFMTYIIGFVTRLTRRVSLVEQELLTLREHLSSPPVFSGVRVTRSLVLYVCFVDRCLSFCTFFWAIVLSVLLRYTDSDYPFGIFKLFLTLHEQYFLHIVCLLFNVTYSVFQLYWLLVVKRGQNRLLSLMRDGD